MRFLVEIKLPKPLTKTFLQQVPAQRSLIDELLFDGIIQSYSLSDDWSRSWVHIEADNKEQVWSILNEMPIMPFIEVEISTLMFHLQPEHVLPVFSSN